MKTLFAIVLGFAAFAAGCASPQPASTASLEGAMATPLGTTGVLHGAGVVLAPPAGLVTAIGAQFHTGVAAAEPTIGTTTDGAVYITGNIPNPTCATVGDCPPLPYANFRAGPTILRSLDKGQTWVDVFPKLPTGDSMKLRTWDPYVYVDPATNRVFMDDIYPVGCGFLSFTDDGGESWTHNPASCGNPHVNDHQTIVAAKPRVLPTVGYPNLVYRCVNNVAYPACAISVNGGQSFLPQIPLAGVTQAGCAAITGHLEADHEGRVYLGMPCGDEPDEYPGVARTEDDGRTWTVSVVSDKHVLDGHDVDLAVDEAGNVYAFWLSEGLPWLAVSTNHAETWSEAVMVAAPGVTAVKFNAIAAGASGRIAFAYVGTTLPGGYENEPSVCSPAPALPCTEPDAWANATWNAYVGIVEHALVVSPTIQTVTANDPVDPLARGACPGRCYGMTDFIDIQIDHEGRPWASFVDVCVAECVTDPSVLYDGNLGFAATTISGPALRGASTQLPAILPPPRHDG